MLEASYTRLIGELKALADPERAIILQRFFKTAPGEYGAGDQFLGVTVPIQRRAALLHRDLPLNKIRRLLESPIHEHRFCALEILVWQYEHADARRQQEVFRFYLENVAGINSWDLVDNSAPYIVGEHLRKRSRAPLKKLARSRNIWARRIAIISTLQLIRYGEVAPTFEIARLLLRDSHDLIHKAVGWALRETGKVSGAELVDFLKQHHHELPRTALRYAIERFPVEQRRRFLRGQF